MAAGVPLVESGTAGYLGQVQPLLKVSQSHQSRLLAYNTPRAIYRTGQSASIAYLNRLQKLFRCVQFAQPRVKRYIA